MVALVTPAELREFLDVDEGDLPDLRADLLIELVSGLILSYCNRPTFIAPDADHPGLVLLDGSGTDVILLPVHPVVDVVSIVEDPRGAATVLVEDVDYEWTSTGILRGRWLRRARWYAVTYRAGYAETPDVAKLVALRVAARAAENPEGLVTEGTGSYNSGSAFDDTRLPTLATPDRRDLDAAGLRVQVA